METRREIWLDWLRVSACFMVMLVHSTEPFYLGGDGSLIASRTDALWAAFFDSLVRSCVPLFVIASSYLQFPLHYSTGEFFRRRAVRILIPFVIWSVFYAFWWGEPVSNLKDLLLNFNYAAGHLWFVYMLIGLYIIMPLLSPWAEKVSRKELTAYIGLWLLTTTIPFLRDWLASRPLAVTYGPTGIPRQALYPLWGEASWNSYGTFYYISGLVGYLLLGLWFRRFGDSISRKKSFAVGIPCYLAGFAITFGGFLRRVFQDTAEEAFQPGTGADGFPLGGGVDLAVRWETSWGYDTLGVALMAIGIILMMRNIKADGRFYRHAILPASNAGYGMYLGHMVALSAFSGLYIRIIPSASLSPALATPLIILATAASAFITTALAAILLRRIPRLGKYIIG